MLRWSLLFIALVFLALGSLTVWPSPAWSKWQLALLAGEFGHWLALVALLVAVVAWRGGFGGATALVAVGAAGLLLKPSVQAWRVAPTLPAALDRLGAPALERAPFTVGGFLYRDPAPVVPETLAYAGELALDFYRAVDRAKAPCVIAVHGGGWDSGDRGQLATFNAWLARRGYAVAAISYRLAPRYRWPAQRSDVLAAVAFLKAHAEGLGIDATRLVLLGRSAGGQIAETTAYAAHDPAIRGVVGFYAPADVVLGYESGREDDELRSRHLLRQYLGGSPESAPSVYASASAVGRADGASPPTLLIHGRIDSLVWIRHSERLAARLAELGVRHALIVLPWATHAFDYNLAGPGGQLTRYALERFLGAVTK